MVASVVAKPYILSERPRWLLASLPEPWNVLSWAIVNGGFQRTAQIAWLYLHADEIATAPDVRDWMRAEMRSAELAGAVGFMTSRRQHAWVEAHATEGEIDCWAVGTVGLSNALRVGDPAAVASTCPGTINLLVCCSQALTPEAATELIALVSEAKALAMLSSGIASCQSARPATGTGTDYLAIAWPNTGERLRYAGKHTEVGSAAGRAAFLAVAEGVWQWTREYRPKP
jgi:adenosylcobinamide amidohydrolase